MANSRTFARNRAKAAIAFGGGVLLGLLASAGSAGPRPAAEIPRLGGFAGDLGRAFCLGVMASAPHGAFPCVLVTVQRRSAGWVNSGVDADCERRMQ
jgi:hypothetical protein